MAIKKTRKKKVAKSKATKAKTPLKKAKVKTSVKKTSKKKPAKSARKKPAKNKIIKKVKESLTADSIMDTIENHDVTQKIEALLLQLEKLVSEQLKSRPKKRR